jgi:hypothetical protein
VIIGHVSSDGESATHPVGERIGCSMARCSMSVYGAVRVQYEHRLHADDSRSDRINTILIQSVTKSRWKSLDFPGGHFRDC